MLGFKCVSQVHFEDKSLFDSLGSALRGPKIKHHSSFSLLTLTGSTSQYTVLNTSKFSTAKLLFLTFTLKPQHVRNTILLVYLVLPSSVSPLRSLTAVDAADYGITKCTDWLEKMEVQNPSTGSARMCTPANKQVFCVLWKYMAI